MQTKFISLCEIKDPFTTFLPLTQFSAVICKVLSFSQSLLTCAVFIQIELRSKSVSSIFPKMLVHFLMSSPAKFFCRKRPTFLGKDSFPWFCTSSGHPVYQFLTEPAFSVFPSHLRNDSVSSKKPTCPHFGRSLFTCAFS